MEFGIRSQVPPSRATRPLGGKPARQTLPLDAPGRVTGRLGAERPGSLDANAALRRLKARGKLTPEVRARLRTLATQPLAPGIDRRALIGAALAELADPERVSQGSRQTCAAAVVQAKLAQDDPAEYLRLLSGLAAPAGEVTLASGEVLTRDPNWRPASGRSPTGDLLQPAFMQFATGSYDSRTDTRAVGAGRAQGLYAAEQARLLGAITGMETATVFGNGPQVLDALQRAITGGRSVPVVLVGPPDAKGRRTAHDVLVERIQDGRVTFVDPAGKRRSMRLEAFSAMLESASLPKALVSAALLASSAGRKGSLAGDFDFWGAITRGAKAVADGFNEHIARPVVSVVQGGVQALHDHVVRPVAEAFATAGNALQEHVIQPIAHAAEPLMTYVFQPLYDYVLRPLYESFLRPLAADVLWPAWQYVYRHAQVVKDFLEKNKDTLMSLGAIACAVTPGLNAVALVLAIGGAIEGGQKVLAGLKSGDWKLALVGAGELLAAAGTAIGGPILSRAIGTGAQAMARLAGGLAKLAGSAAALADVCDERLDATTRFGRLLSMVALGVGGGASALGEGAEKAAAGFAEIAQKANGYYDRTVQTYAALMKGEANWKQTLGMSLVLAADLHQEVRQDASGKRLTYQLKSTADYLAAGSQLWDGVHRPDPSLDPEAMGSMYSLAARLDRDVRNDWNGEVPSGAEQGQAGSDRYAYTADLWRQTKGLGAGSPLDQVQAAWNVAKKAGESKGDEQLAQWLRRWTGDLEAWGTQQGEVAKEWAACQIEAAWKWWAQERRQPTPT